MTKREFLKELEDRLQMLDEKERKDMIEEYTQHISMCMKSGMKEEEAIEDFGDMDDLIAEILEAYHLDPEYEVKSRERSGKTGIADLLPKDFFKKKTKIAKAGNKSNVNDGNNKSNHWFNRFSHFPKIEKMFFLLFSFKKELKKLILFFRFSSPFVFVAFISSSSST